MSIYIPLWLYYNYPPHIHNESQRGIYIPLWLYYNLKHTEYRIQIINLHSTLVILQSGSGAESLSVGKDLHSTLVILQSAIDTVATVATGSTFHSGYITIIQEFHPFSHSVVSTFHSGYITMPPRYTIPSGAHLSTFHSGYITMNTLIDLCCALDCIYIPLWLYYN